MPYDSDEEADYSKMDLVRLRPHDHVYPSFATCCFSFSLFIVFSFSVKLSTLVLV